MVLDPIPQSLPVHFFGSRPQPPTSRCTRVLPLRRISSLFLLSTLHTSSPETLSTYLLPTLRISSLFYTSPPSYNASSSHTPTQCISSALTSSQRPINASPPHSLLPTHPLNASPPHSMHLLPRDTLYPSPPYLTHLLPLLRISSPSSSQRPLYASPRDLTHLHPYCLNPHQTRFRFELFGVGRKKLGLRRR